MIKLLDNPVMNYAWGSRHAIAALLGRSTPSEQPQAELWMGAHPKAPSRVLVDGRDISLSEWIAHQPETILGRDAAERFKGDLPYLFKVLAAEQALSIQAHPNLSQARTGFERENRLGLALDAPQRNYRDANHKPECICALTDFWALNGFRAAHQISDLLGSVVDRSHVDLLAPLQAADVTVGLRPFFDQLMHLSPVQQHQLVEDVVAVVDKQDWPDPAFDWVRRLYNQFPGDIGALSPLIFNLIQLAPGEAMYLPARQMHAYLRGTGIELMANSDNVLRGGLTAKHVDVGELMKVLRFVDTRTEILYPRPISPCLSVYDTPAAEFELAIARLTPSQSHVGSRRTSAEIWLCTQGQAVFTTSRETLTLAQGQSAIVPAASDDYYLTGSAVLYRAGVPSSKNGDPLHDDH